MIPFIAVDGEGGGQDESLRQNYLALRAGNDLLVHSNGDRLSSMDCFEFLCSLDPDAGIYIAYYFDYDVTMLLRDVSLKVILGLDKSTYWNGFLISYLPHKFFSISRAEWPDGTKSPKRLSKILTINDVGPFFQQSFHKTLTQWGVGTDEQLAEIARGKSNRNHFELMTTEILEYNRTECELLVELMTKFREVCAETGYLPDRWQGPGWLAAKMMKVHGVPRRKEYQDRYDKSFWEYSNSAYYGGRFEISRVGNVARTVYEYDINSAYPFAMLDLPCVEHGRWEAIKELPVDDRFSYYIADMSFLYEENNRLCDFPIRDKTGTIYYPRQGRGWYWSPEIKAAIRRGKCKIKVHSGFAFSSSCFCRGFDYIRDVFTYRKSIGKSTKGYALKLGLNSHYGKLCQSIGEAPYANPMWGGLITSACRAMLIDAYSRADDSNILMLATDGIYSLVPLDLNLGSELGQWEVKEHDKGMFFVQPGLYFYNDFDRPKTRGIPQVKVLEYQEQFRTAWAKYIQNPKQDLFGEFLDFPEVPITLTSFIGYRLAWSRFNPKSAGRWVEQTRTVSFDWRSKRDHGRICDDAIETSPRDGRATLRTLPYFKHIGGEPDLRLADQPDYTVFAAEIE